MIESKQDKSENKDSTYGGGFSIDLANPSNFSANINGSKGNGEAEDLGFNTNKDKAQEVTKDEERHLDAELHTDLIGEDKRNEIKYAYKKLGSLKEILDQKKFKESMEGILVDKFKDEHQKEFNLIKEESLSLEDKQKLAQNLVERYLRENGYEGVTPEVLLTDEAHSFTVDSKDKETGAKRREKIYFSINDIADPNLAFSKLFVHEKAHMNTYDEGKDGEETSIHTREKVGNENKNKVFTEEEKADYLNNLRNKYKNQKSIEQQFAEAKLVPEKDKENFINSEEAAILMNPEVFVEKNINLLAKMFKKSAEEILNNPDEYAYKYIQETRNKEVYNREFLIKYQEKLEERIKNEKDPFKRKELEKGLFWKMSPSFSIYHNGYIDENGEVAIYTNPKNEKWVNGKGEEYIFNIETGRIVKDGINNGTFNIAGNDKNSFNPIDTIIHFGLDVTSWENYGLGKNDVLTKEQRKIFSEMGSKYIKNPIFKSYIDNLKGGKLTESTYREYLKFEGGTYHEQFQ